MNGVKKKYLSFLKGERRDWNGCSVRDYFHCFLLWFRPQKKHSLWPVRCTFDHNAGKDRGLQRAVLWWFCIEFDLITIQWRIESIIGHFLLILHWTFVDLLIFDAKLTKNMPVKNRYHRNYHGDLGCKLIKDQLCSFFNKSIVEIPLFATSRTTMTITFHYSEYKL